LYFVVFLCLCIYLYLSSNVKGGSGYALRGHCGLRSHPSNKISISTVPYSSISCSKIKFYLSIYLSKERKGDQCTC
jgi:hypothetical protein